MDTFESFDTQLYSVNEHTFDNIALQLFSFQAENNPVYKSFLENLGVLPARVSTVNEIPFMPISFFKRHSIKTGAWQPEVVFSSSGTTSAATSTHAVRDRSFYLSHSERCFRHFFGEIGNYHVLALLPSYLERTGSSLVAMISHFVERSGSPYSGFYLHDADRLLRDISLMRRSGKTVLLFGVSFALVDLAEQHSPDLSGCIIIETGGMKGRRREITRTELHSVLKKGLNVDRIYSEYGMTEMLSQAYTNGDERFFCPPWLKVYGRDLSDPLENGLLNETAGINIIDLGNWHSIAFIGSEDLGKVYTDGSFEVLGRIDNTDSRGCNLMIA